MYDPALEERQHHSTTSYFPTSSPYSRGGELDPHLLMGWESKNLGTCKTTTSQLTRLCRIGPVSRSASPPPIPPFRSPHFCHSGLLAVPRPWSGSWTTPASGPLSSLLLLLGMLFPWGSAWRLLSNQNWAQASPPWKAVTNSTPALSLTSPLTCFIYC